MHSYFRYLLTVCIIFVSTLVSAQPDSLFFKKKTNADIQLGWRTLTKFLLPTGMLVVPIPFPEL